MHFLWVFFSSSLPTVYPYTANLCGYRQLRKFSAISASMLKLFFYRPSSLKQLYLWSQVLLRQQSVCEPHKSAGKTAEARKIFNCATKNTNQKIKQDFFPD